MEDEEVRLPWCWKEAIMVAVLSFWDPASPPLANEGSSLITVVEAVAMVEMEEFEDGGGGALKNGIEEADPVLEGVVVDVVNKLAGFAEVGDGIINPEPPPGVLLLEPELTGIVTETGMERDMAEEIDGRPPTGEEEELSYINDDG